VTKIWKACTGSPGLRCEDCAYWAADVCPNQEDVGVLSFGHFLSEQAAARGQQHSNNVRALIEASHTHGLPLHWENLAAIVAAASPGRPPSPRALLAVLRAHPELFGASVGGVYEYIGSVRPTARRSEEALSRADGTDEHDDARQTDAQLAILVSSFWRPLYDVEPPGRLEAMQLLSAAQAGDPVAREEMSSRNIRLVVRISRRYLGRGLDLLELVSEGTIGLMSAIDKFDVESGYQFSTYASWWIRQGVTRAIADQGRMIRLPVHVHEQLQTERRVPLDTVTSRAEAWRGNALLDARTGLLDTDSVLPSSLSDHEREITTRVAEVAVARADASRLRELVEDALQYRLRWVIARRFGPVRAHANTLDALGRELGVTRERVRQIEAEALGTLRTSIAIRRFRGLIPLSAARSRSGSQPQRATPAPVDVPRGRKSPAAAKAKRVVSSHRRPDRPWVAPVDAEASFWDTHPVDGDAVN
jgi:RNA polymerase sigma factor (sigma-70 family)